MITNEQLLVYKELSEKVKTLIKTNTDNQAIIVAVQKSNTESLGDRITNYATSVNIKSKI